MSDLHVHFHGSVAAGAKLVISVPCRVQSTDQVPQELADAIETLGAKTRAVDALVADLPPAPTTTTTKD